MTYTEFCLTVITVCVAFCTTAFWTMASAREARDRYWLHRCEEEDKKE
jgi:hypothetical protein